MFRISLGAVAWIRVHVLADTVTLPFEWGLLGWLPVGQFQTSGIGELANSGVRLPFHKT